MVSNCERKEEIITECRVLMSVGIVWSDLY